MSNSSNSSFNHLQTVAHYLKADFPDQRFLPFRLFIHSRNVNDVLPGLKYFEPLYTKIKKVKKTKSKLTPMKLKRVFESKEKLYRELFTTGNVNIRTEYSTPAITQERALSSKHEDKLDLFKKKGKIMSQKTNILDMMVDNEKKKETLTRRPTKRISLRRPTNLLLND